LNEQELINALPSWGDAELPANRDRSLDSDRRGFTDVGRILIRSWPFLRPQILGYWHEFSIANSTNQTSDNEWSYSFVPPLVTLLTLLGPVTGLLPVGVSWQLDLLVTATVLMTLLIWSLMFVQGRWFVISSVTLTVVCSATLLFSILVVTGWTDNLQVSLVSFGCLCIWLLQYRTADGKLQVRLRLGCHLVYYYVVIWFSILVGAVVGLFTVDLLNQSILQAQPLTPFLSEFISRPEISRETIETLTITQRHELQRTYIMFVIAVGILMFPFGAILPYYNIWIMQRINQDLRLALVERWHQLSLKYHSDHRVGDSVYRIYQDSAQVTAIIGMIISVIQQFTMYLVTILFVTALDPILGFLAATIGVIALIWGHWFSPRLRVRSLVARESNSDLTSRIQEVFSSIKVIKAHGAENFEQRRFEEDSIVAFNSAYKVRSLTAIITIVMFTLSAAILIGGEFMMAIWANQSRETFAAVLIGLIGLSFTRWNLAAFQWAQGEFFKTSGQVRGLLRSWASAQDMAMGLDRVFHILDIEPDVKNDPDAIPMPTFSEEINFDDVSFAYQADRPVLKNISFTAKPGTITAIVGPTGSGKSSLVALLTRIFDPDSGSVSIDGNDLRKLDLDSLRSNVSIALQENVLFAMSVRDNIRYAVPEATDEQVRLAATVACVDDYIDELPDGLDTMLGDRGGKLSTGQRQRLSIARAIVKDSPILILDEPTAALDANTEHQVMERLAKWGEGRAIFLITHRISTIQRGDQILYIDQGEIVESGSHTELMQISNGRYRRFVETESSLSNRSDKSTDGTHD
jgi:ABC-type multidrug transport system fused ATPase/permease subunit|tara:strand:+ start:7068 stop:9479 length:2412 start_codon:yes stop_codon:yes gene_type:complete